MSRRTTPNGFNIEGFEFAPGSTPTAYLGFRSPLVTHNGKQDAVIVPVTNASSLIGAPAGTATFDNPIYPRPRRTHDPRDPQEQQ